MNPVLQQRNGKLTIDNSQIVSHAVAETFITTDSASGSGTLTVKNITGFAVNQVLLIEDLGAENAEIILTHASTAPSGTTITLASNTVRAHATGAKVRVLLYNRFELSHATTATGSKTVLTVATTANFNPPSSLGTGLVAIDPTVVRQVMYSSEHTSGYYFARYSNSITTTYSGYTDALPYGGWSESSVGFMIDRACRDLGVDLSDKVTRTDCYDWIDEVLALFQGKQMRLPGLFTYNYVAGQSSRGVNTITIPTDIYDNQTPRSLVALRIGDNTKVTFIDPTEYEERVGYIKTGVTTQASAADTTLYIDNSYDFADAGSVAVYISGTKYTITYTGVTRSATAGALTGVPASGTGSISVTIPAATNVWQDEEEGTPEIATVRNGSIEFYPLPDTNFDNLNEYLDYATVCTAVNSDGDTIDFKRYDAVRWYLTWRIKMAVRNNGNLDQADPYYLTYREVVNDFIRTTPPEGTQERAPNINTMNRSARNWRFHTNTSTDQ